MLPLAAAVLALLDGEHKVELSASHGRVHLVLHHDRSAAPGPSSLPPGHQHRGLMRLLGTTDGNSHPDHDLLFASGGLQDSVKNAGIAPGEESAASQPPPALVWRPAAPVRLDRRESVELEPAPWHPPAPREDVWGSVVLLI